MMRLWHKELLSVLPRQQLISQWRELCCIAKNIKVNGTPNHILVNKILLYENKHFIYYTKLVLDEFSKRNYVISKISFQHLIENLDTTEKEFNDCHLNFDEIFKDWHNEKYLRQCYYNLEEKYDCGGISKTEFSKIKRVLNF